MTVSFTRAVLLTATLFVAGCNESTTLADISPRAESVSDAVLADKNMVRTSWITVRIFKEEGKLEIWKQKTNGRYGLIKEYDICKWSGQLGPKFTEGDRQAPEGFYAVRPRQMNPNSQYFLSFDMGYPNAYDKAHGRTGTNLMVHGACSSSGCYSMTDAQVAEIFAFGREAFRGGQTEFQVQAYPFRMTPANMARYRKDPNYAFWKMLKVGYDHFEITKVPPKVDVCEKRYVFDQVPERGNKFSAQSACPAMSQPDSLRTAYQSYQTTYDKAFSAAIGSRKAATPKPSIVGAQEAKMVADWSRARARGERVPIEPPNLSADGSITVTARMGRADSPAGRRLAAAEAKEAEKKRALEEKALAAAAEKAAKIAAAQPKPLAPEPAKVATAASAAGSGSQTAVMQPPSAPEAEPSGWLGGVRKRMGSVFGG